MPNIFTLLKQTAFLFIALLALSSCSEGPEAPEFDVIISNGTVYDGSGGEPFTADIGIEGDRIKAIGDLDETYAITVIDATGMAVTPGFINMLSWAPETLMINGAGLSDLKQGVTLEVFGEGWSFGPWSDAMKEENLKRQTDFKYDIEWTTLGEYLDFMEARGIAMNIASFVGATTLRIHEIGYQDRPATEEELSAMQELVREAMAEGALGVGSSLIYAPANFASTEELIALASAAGEYDGMYISHMRSESGQIFEALDELFTIAREAGVRAEIYHLKASGEPNWDKIDEVFARIEAARVEGLEITADMYTYPASATGLDAVIPLWTQEGGIDAWVERLKDPEIRARALAEMRDQTNPSNRWNNVGPERTLLIGFKNPELKQYIGKYLSEVAEIRGEDPAETALNLVVEDGTRVDVIYFSMTEENVRKKIAQSWVAFDSDEGAYSDDEIFTRNSAHPRAYGTFARVLGKYVRDEKIITLPDAIRRLTSFPATNLKIRERGLLTEGYYADIVIFDPATIQDHATFEYPRQYATGVIHVFVNGEQVLRDGEHTGSFPGRVVRGPGWEGWQAENN
jgi:N-acyl-D-amino-acid deacylase